MTEAQEPSKVNRKDVKKIEADKKLQQRVGTGKIDEQVVEKAQKVIDTNQVDFGPLAKPFLDELKMALETVDEKETTKEIMESISMPIMNLKANAGTFKFELISGLTGTVLNFLENIKEPDKKVYQIVDLLTKTIQLILAYKMTGDGGPNGKALMAAFAEVCQKTHMRLAEKGNA